MSAAAPSICRVIRNALGFAVPPGGSAVCVGSFDGLHRGHQHLISTAVGSGLPAVVVSFYPHPAVALGRIEDRRRTLSTFRQKCNGLGALGVGYFAPIFFSSVFRELSADAFIREYLVERLGAKLVVLGEDACFGKGRELRVAGIEKLLGALGVDCRVVNFLEHGGERISSRRVRAAIVAGELRNAEELLGRPYAVEGRVEHGDRRGTGIGFPTANLYLPGQLLPPSGVYATRTQLAGQSRLSVTNLGLRPTFHGTELRMETHLLDFPARPLYHEHLEVSFLGFVRGERAFRGVPELKAQITKDVEWVRNHYA